MKSSFFLAEPIWITSDFSRLILSTKTVENSPKVSSIVCSDSKLSIENSWMSFAYCIPGLYYFVNFVAYLYSNYFLMLFLASIARISAHRMNKYGDKWHPCRTPLPKLKYRYSVYQPLFITELFISMRSILILYILYIRWKLKKMQTLKHEVPF